MLISAPKPLATIDHLERPAAEMLIERIQLHEADPPQRSRHFCLYPLQIPEQAQEGVAI